MLTIRCNLVCLLAGLPQEGYDRPVDLPATVQVRQFLGAIESLRKTTSLTCCIGLATLWTSRHTVLSRRGKLTGKPTLQTNSSTRTRSPDTNPTKYSMPHKVYHGKTGVVYNVTKSAVGVIIYKKVKHRYIEKRINLRIEHIQPSRSRDDFLRRVKENAALKAKAKSDGTTVQVKRQAALPREARQISFKENRPETLAPVAYETTI